MCLPVRLPVCLPVPVSFLRGFIENTYPGSKSKDNLKNENNLKNEDNLNKYKVLLDA